MEHNNQMEITDSPSTTSQVTLPSLNPEQVDRLKNQIVYFKALNKKYSEFNGSTQGLASTRKSESETHVSNAPIPSVTTKPLESFNTTGGGPVQPSQEQESIIPQQPALSWQCFGSLLYMGPSRPPDGMISVASSDIGPFSKASNLPLVLTTPYTASFREQQLKANVINKSKHKLLLLQRHTRSLLIEKFISLESSNSLTHPVVGPVVGLASRRSHFRIKRQSKKDIRNYDREQKKKKLEREESFRKRQKLFLTTIINHREEFLKFHKGKRMDAAKTARAVKLRMESLEKGREKEDLRSESRRLQALRENDMESYTKLVQETKNVRLQYLLNESDKYIASIHAMIQEQQIAGTSQGSDSSEPQQHSGTQEDIDKMVLQSGRSTKASQQYFQVAHRRVEKVIQPQMIKGGDLKEYQLAGLQWLVSLYNNSLNGILADDMGLGKTIQTIALLSYLMEVKHNNGPFMIVVPLSTLSNWVNEASKWAPDMIKVIFKGPPTVRKQIFREEIEPGLFNTLITTYEYIMKDKGQLRKIQWQYIIVDEGHRMKNAQSKFAQTLGSMYQSKHRLLLTGTPLQNNLPELWALLNFLLPSIFSSVETFDQWFNKPFASFKTQTAGTTGGEDSGDMTTSLTQEERLLIVHRLHEVLRPFMLRRVKDQVLDQLPEKIEKVLRCDLSGWQRKLYSLIHKRSTTMITKDGTVIGGGLNNIIMQLRKICNHPYLFLSDWMIDDDLIRCSGKFELLDRMLPKLKAAGHRILIFSQMTQVMTILEKFFEYRKFSYLRLDGGTASEDREKRMYMFNDPDSPYFIFLLSTRAGGLGLNLATADTVILFDSDWNPMMDAQAQDRAHRIGQKNEVRVFRLVTTSPMEEKILSRATDKRNLTGLVVDAGKFHKDSSGGVDRKEMMAALLRDYGDTGEGEEDGEEAEVEVPDDEQINEMMAIYDFEMTLYQKMDRERDETRRRHWMQFHKSQGVPANMTPPLPSRLMTPEEIPAWMKDPSVWHSKHTQLLQMHENSALVLDPSTMDMNDSGDEGGVGESSQDTRVNNPRKRKVISYDEDLTDEQFDRLLRAPTAEESKAAAVAVAAAVPTTASTPNESTSIASGKSATKFRFKVGTGTSSSTPPSAVITEAIAKDLMKIIKDICKLETPEGYLLADLFKSKPDKGLYPDYYQIIKSPICLKDIIKKLKHNLYSRLKDLETDLKLLSKNARLYNDEKSLVYRDSETVRQEIHSRFGPLILKYGRDAFDLSTIPPLITSTDIETDSKFPNSSASKKSRSSDSLSDLQPSREFVFAESTATAKSGGTTSASASSTSTSGAGNTTLTIRKKITFKPILSPPTDNSKLDDSRETEEDLDMSLLEEGEEVMNDDDDEEDYIPMIHERNTSQSQSSSYSAAPPRTSSGSGLPKLILKASSGDHTTSGRNGSSTSSNRPTASGKDSAGKRGRKRKNTS